MTIAYDWIAYHAKTTPDSLAQTDVDSGRAFTYAQLNDRVGRLATYLRCVAGVNAGDRVAVLALNSIEMFEVMFACRRLGAIFLPLNWRLAVPEITSILDDAVPQCLIYAGDFTDKVAEISSALPGVGTLRFEYGEPSPYEETLSTSEPLLDSVEVSMDDTWAILYTSGTSGRPKGVLVTYKMVCYSSINVNMGMRITNRSRGLTIMPLFHAGGIYVFAAFIFHFGGHNYIVRRFDARQTLALLNDKDIKITHLLGVPTNFIMMSELDEFEQADFSHLETLFIGASAAPPALLERYLEKGIILQQGWGMTETATSSTFLSKEMAKQKIGSCGLPAMYASIRVVDASGSDVEPGSIGELLIKGPTVTPGYWNRPDANAAAFTEDGWLRTGDAVRIDEDGYLFVIDRFKDMFISGGENVYPVEIEGVLYRVPEIMEAAVIGIADPKWGEVGRAFVVLRNSVTVGEEQIRAYCRANLAPYKVPKEFCFIEQLPRNATGKLQKHMLPRD